jgi:septal ring factor EnvC (AmiA/AmiB activator)
VAASCRRLETQARSLEKLIDSLRKALEAAPVAGQAPFEPLRGKLPWPCSRVACSRAFGQPRAGGSLKWQGMLVGTERGARVRAPFGGRVVYADWLPGMGLMLVLDHGQGYMSLYGHNEELFRKVRRDRPVGRRDRVGRDSGGHKHAGALLRSASRTRARESRNLAAAPVNVKIMCKRR